LLGRNRVLLQHGRGRTRPRGAQGAL
jgi:hypothetical protein